ncbi:hypothetical protein BDZ91DRAFT_848056 [Kalaharituber pfeilii]|nr:hypothetical protein BDZ91DRAFT_848056 [Kalaharituber pfeilii]
MASAVELEMLGVTRSRVGDVGYNLLYGHEKRHASDRDIEVEGFGKGKVMEWNRTAVSNFTVMRLETGRCGVWLKRIGAAESEKCSCGEVQTGEHLAFQCSQQRFRPEGFREWGDVEKNWKRTAENGEEWDELERFFSGIKF